MSTSTPSAATRKQRRADTIAAGLWGLYWLGVCLYALYDSTDEGTNAWVWVVPTFVAVGPLVALLMLVPAARRRRSYVRMFLSALTVTVVTLIGLMQGVASLQVALFVGLLGPAWGFWLVHRVDERENDAARERGRRMAQERHEVVLRAIAGQRTTGRRVAGHRRR